MYRNVIFEYLNGIHQELSLHDVEQITICKLNLNSNQSVSRIFHKNDSLTSYLVRPPRVYSKELQLDQMNNSLFELLLASDSSVFHANYNDFTSEILDPFYLKNVQDLHFQTIWGFPCCYQDTFLGFILFYFNDEVTSFDISLSGLRTLFLNLSSDETNEFTQIIKNKMFNQYGKYYLVESLETNRFMVSSDLKELLNLPTLEVEAKDNKSLSKLDDFKNGPNVFKITDEIKNVDVYIQSKLTKSQIIHPIYSKSCLSTELMNSASSIIYLDLKTNITIKQYDSLFLELNSRFQESSYYVIELDLNQIILIFLKMVKKNDSLSFLHLFKKSNLYLLSSGKDFTKDTRIESIIDYLHSVHPDTFNWNEYVKYRKQTEEANFKLMNS